jgi:hypothetical protein
MRGIELFSYGEDRADRGPTAGSRTGGLRGTSVREKECSILNLNLSLAVNLPHILSSLPQSQQSPGDSRVTEAQPAGGEEKQSPEGIRWKLPSYPGPPGEK